MMMRYKAAGTALTVLLLSIAPAALGDHTIPQLGTGAPLGGNEQIPMAQGALPAVTTTPLALFNYINATPVPINSQSGSAYNLAPTDCNRWVLFTTASGATLTTTNAMPAGCLIMVSGNSRVAIQPSNQGDTIVSPQGWSGTAGAKSIVLLNVDSNSNGTAAEYVLQGDGS